MPKLNEKRRNRISRKVWNAIRQTKGITFDPETCKTFIRIPTEVKKKEIRKSLKPFMDVSGIYKAFPSDSTANGRHGAHRVVVGLPKFKKKEQTS